MKIRILTALIAMLIAGAAVATPPAYPYLTVDEPEFGPWFFSDLEPPMELVRPYAGIPLEFSWSADASWYGGVILGYRYGWDLVDPDDPNDPGWTTPDFEPGLTVAPPQNLSLGSHTLHIMVIDEQGLWNRVGFLLEVCNLVPNDESSWSLLKSAFGSGR